MTLAVARRLRRSVALWCDTRVTDAYEIERGYLTGALKAVILDPVTCVAVAGSPHPAFQAVRALAERRQHSSKQFLDLHDTAATLRDESRAAEGRVEFLMVSLDPPGVVAVKGGTLEREDQVWIGHWDAFRAFQQHYHEPSALALRAAIPDLNAERAQRLAAIARSQTHESRADVYREMGYWDEDTIQDMVTEERMRQAIGDVIADPNVSTVGELAIGVQPGVGGLRYIPQGAFVSGGLEKDLTSTSGGTAAGGTFAYSVCVPQQAGVGALGVHFRQGRFGALFHPLVSDTPCVVPNVDEHDFVAAVEHGWGIALQEGPLG